MDNNIPELYKKYGWFINLSRSFPLATDGLKLVERRLLLSAYQVARNDFTKSARIDGHNMGQFHPHSSTYQTIVNMVHRKLLIGQGSFGSDIGISPTGAAASRYTEIKSSPFIKKICFENIKFVEWFTNELDQQEPEYLPTMYPVCFLGTEYVQGIGFGFRTLIPTYSAKDLNKRLMWLLDPKLPKPTIKPYSTCNILSDNDRLEALLTLGESSIRIQGQIKEDRIHSRIYLKSWPPIGSFEKILNKNTYFENGDIGVLDQSNEMGCNIIFEVTRKKNREEIYTKFLEQLKTAITTDVHFKINMVDTETQTVKTMSVDSLLLKCYNKFKDINKVVLEKNILILQDKQKDYILLQKIRPHLSTIMVDKKISVDYNNRLNLLSQMSQVSVDDIKELFQKYNIDKLLKIDFDTQELENTIKALQNSLEKLDVYVLNQYVDIQTLDVDGGSNL